MSLTYIKLGLKLFLVIFFLPLVGCGSSKSTVLTRDEMNLGWQTISGVHGVPITVKVPTHVKLYVYKKHFLSVDSVGDVNKVSFMNTEDMYDFGQEYIVTEKIVMVDFKRPAAGAFNLDVEYDNQSIKRIQQDITDETIARTGEFLSQLGGLGLSLANTPGEGGDQIDKLTREVKSVKAVGIFEIDAPDFEQQVMDFLDSHLNSKCNLGTCKIDSVAGNQKQLSNEEYGPRIHFTPN